MEAAQVLRLEHSNSQLSLSDKGLSLHDVALYPVKRMDELVYSQAPALHSINRTEMVGTIVAFIGDYLSFIGATMKDEVIAEVATMMIDNHKHLPVDAIKTFFYECKRGTYGYHYNKMDGSRLLMWFDKFVDEYYKAVDDIEYAKHESTKGDLATPMSVTNDKGDVMTFDEYYAKFHGEKKRQEEMNSKVKDIRLAVQKRCMPLYNQMPVEEADKIVEAEIIKEMKNQGLTIF